MKTIYLIKKSKGEWDDYITWVDRAYYNEIDAQNYAQKYNTKLGKLKTVLNDLYEKKSLEENWNDSFWDKYNKITEINKCFVFKTKLI